MNQNNESNINKTMFNIVISKLNKIERRLDNIEKDLHEMKNEHIDIKDSTKKMDNHIDNVMKIYSGYKNTLDYVSSYFGFVALEIKDNDLHKTIEDDK
jgi:septation ring formation regulator EzrA